MIDCLYNITVMLEDPLKPAEFRKSGYRMALEALEEDIQKYAKNPDPRWAEWFLKRRDFLELGIRRDGFKLEEIMAQKRWPLLGTYLQAKKNVPLTEHHLFLKRLTYGYGREYSDYSQGTFQGLLETAMPYLERDLPIEDRPKLDEVSLRGIFVHLARSAAVLLCTLTELQAYFRFDGARINERLHRLWNVLTPAPEVKDLYESRYAQSDAGDRDQSLGGAAARAHYPRSRAVNGIVLPRPLAPFANDHGRKRLTANFDRGGNRMPMVANRHPSCPVPMIEGV